MLKTTEAVRAIFGHYNSTDDKPVYDNCLKGYRSWFTYQEEVTPGTANYVPSKYTLPELVIKVIKTAFNCLE